MDLEASWLLDQVKEDQRRTSERQHRDARRQHALRHASLMLGTGKTAGEVTAWLTAQALTLPKPPKDWTAQEQRTAVKESLSGMTL